MKYVNKYKLLEELWRWEKICKDYKVLHRDAVSQGIANAKMRVCQQFREFINTLETKEENFDNANNVEPKFKVGDWIVSSVLGTAHIIGINDFNEYQLEYIDGKQKFSSIDYVNYEYDEWTIQDAKDGDVLVTYDIRGNLEWLFIYRPNPHELCINDPRFYCHYDIKSDSFKKDADYVSVALGTKFCPATKEQRDFLFSKMKEAGYEWDEEKKELRKMKQESRRVRIKEATGTLKEMLDNIDPIELEETRREMLEVDSFDSELNALLKKYEHLPKEEVAECLSFYFRVVQGEPKWTEEDEKNFEILDTILFEDKNYWKMIDWIKSIKQRLTNEKEKDQ